MLAACWEAHNSSAPPSEYCCVLQYIAVRSGAFRCVAVCCGAVHFGVLQCVAMCCNVLQCVAMCCSVLQCVAVCRSVSQCVAVCCCSELVFCPQILPIWILQSQEKESTTRCRATREKNTKRMRDTQPRGQERVPSVWLATHTIIHLTHTIVHNAHHTTSHAHHNTFLTRTPQYISDTLFVLQTTHTLAQKLLRMSHATGTHESSRVKYMNDD